MLNAFKIDVQEMTIVVSFAVHLQHHVDFFLFDEEPFTVVLADTAFDIIVNQDLLVIGLSVLTNALRFENNVCDVFEEKLDINFRRLLGESNSDQFPVSLFQEMQSVLVPQLNELQDSQDLRVDNPQFIIYRLVEHNVVDVRVQFLSLSSQNVNSININVVQYFIDLVRFVLYVHLADQSSEELDQIWVLVVDTEVKTVKQGHGVLLDVI